MSRPVSIVLPSDGDLEPFHDHLPRLQEELARRAVDDEIIVVDDSGEDMLRAQLSKEHPEIHGVVHKQHRGLGRAMQSGALVAKHDLLLFLGPEVSVSEGFLEPLVACLEDAEVLAAVPRILDTDGNPAADLRFENGMLREVEAATGADGPRHLVSVPRAAFLVRRAEFAKSGGLNKMFAPFDGDPLDIGLDAWHRGRRVVEVPDSRVVRHVGEKTDEDAALERAAIEKNRLLATWKHVDDAEHGLEHLAALWRIVFDDSSADQAQELRWLVLALDQLADVAAVRAENEGWECSFEEVLPAGS